jgi:hypothetical protein
MKTLRHIFPVFLILIFAENHLSAQQIPQSFSYQAVAKSDDGSPIKNKEILVEISILKSNPEGTIAYREIQKPTTDAYGLFSLNIGEGTPTFDGATTNFASVVWTDDSYFLKIRIDFNQGLPINGLVDMGTAKLQSVPYSLVSNLAISADRLSVPIQLKLTDLKDVSINSPADQNIIRWNASLAKWEAAAPNGTSGEFIRTDGTSDLTGDWTISSHNIHLVSGNIMLAKGTLSTDTLTISSGQKIAAVSTDGSLSHDNDFEIPTVKAVKTYVDSNTGTGVWQADPNYLYYNGTKNVGIGTNIPSQKFQVDLTGDQGILFDGAFGGNVADLGIGTRMTFFASKSAFRAGTIQNQPDWWDNANVGNYSAAFGLDNEASGLYSFAGGKGSQATGDYAFAFGRNNLAGNAGTAAFGYANSAGGLFSLASGQNNTIVGVSSAALGDHNYVRGSSAFSSGTQNHTGSANGTGGDYSAAFGNSTGAEATGCFTSGNQSLAKGDYSAVFGSNSQTATQAVGAFVSGNFASASGEYSVSLGYYTNSKSYLETSFGKYNAVFGSTAASWVATESVFEIGNGTSDIARSNSFVVMKNGNTGVGLGANAPQSLFEVGTAGDGSYARANSWNIYSDLRLKTNLSKIENPLSIIDSLNGYYYFWKSDADKSRQIGVIAQEVEKVLPEIVKQDKKGIKSVDYEKLTAVLIEAVKEQQKEIVKLSEENKSLTEKNNSYESRLEDIEKYIKAAANLNMNK